MGFMVESTKIRPFSRLLDRADTPLWVIGPDGTLVFLSAAAGAWLQLEAESLIGRKCVAGESISDDPLDFLAATLSPPPGLESAGTARLLVQPNLPGDRSRRFDPLQTRYVRVGQSTGRFTIAIAGEFHDDVVEPDARAASALREQLDSWRRHHAAVAGYVTVGQSRLAKRVHHQIRAACSLRSDLLILSPPGCFADAIAQTVHTRSGFGEPIVSIEGGLMDAELLDASLGAVMPHLADSNEARATAVIRDLDQTPPEAQYRLAEHLNEFGSRLRLIAITGGSPRELSGRDDEARQEWLLESGESRGIAPDLADRLCGLRIAIDPLADRVADIAMIATAMLNRRVAAGETRADRFARGSLDALLIYPWPDNFRELDQAVRQAARACTRDVITPDNLPLAVRSYRPNATVPADQQEFDLDQTVARFEMDLIRRTLQACGGNRAEAARRMNISRARLLRKLEADDQGNAK